MCPITYILLVTCGIPRSYWNIVTLQHVDNHDTLGLEEEDTIRLIDTDKVMRLLIMSIIQDDAILVFVFF